MHKKFDDIDGKEKLFAVLKYKARDSGKFIIALFVTLLVLSNKSILHSRKSGPISELISSGYPPVPGRYSAYRPFEQFLHAENITLLKHPSREFDVPEGLFNPSVIIVDNLPTQDHIGLIVFRVRWFSQCILTHSRVFDGIPIFSGIAIGFLSKTGDVDNMEYFGLDNYTNKTWNDNGIENLFDCRFFHKNMGVWMLCGSDKGPLEIEVGFNDGIKLKWETSRHIPYGRPGYGNIVLH